MAIGSVSFCGCFCSVSAAAPSREILVCVVVQLGTASAALYFLATGKGVWGIAFNSTTLSSNGTRYATFKAVATTPAGTIVDARIAPIVNYNASVALQFSFLLTSSDAASVAVTASGRLLQTTSSTSGNYGFLCVTAVFRCWRCGSVPDIGSLLPFVFDVVRG